MTRGSGIIDFTNGRTGRSHGDRAISVGNINDLKATSIISISTPSCSIPLAGREAPSAQPKSLGAKLAFRSVWSLAGNRHGPYPVEDTDVKLRKSSGVDAPRKKNTFLAPTPFRVF